MKKVLALASVGAFLLSLTGASLAEEKTPAPAPAAPAAAAPATPAAPKMEVPAAPEAEVKARGKEGQETKGQKVQKGQKEPKRPKRKRRKQSPPNNQADHNPGSPPEFGPRGRTPADFSHPVPGGVRGLT